MLFVCPSTEGHLLWFFLALVSNDATVVDEL